MKLIKKHQLENIKEVFSKKEYLALGIISAAAIAYLFYYFTPFAIIAGNIGKLYAWTTVSVEGLMVLFFGLNIPLVVYKFRFFNSFRSKEGSASLFGSTLGAFAAGCPACGVTLASFVGLGAVVSALPFYGLELKVLGLGLLGYSTYSLSNNMKTCSSGIKLGKK